MRPVVSIFIKDCANRTFAPYDYTRAKHCRLIMITFYPARGYNGYATFFLTALCNIEPSLELYEISQFSHFPTLWDQPKLWLLPQLATQAAREKSIHRHELKLSGNTFRSFVKIDSLSYLSQHFDNSILLY